MFSSTSLFFTHPAMTIQVTVTDSRQYPIEVEIGEDGYRMTVESALQLQSKLTLAIEKALQQQ